MVIPTARRSWPMAGVSRSSAINSSSYDVKISTRFRANSLARSTVIWVIARPPAFGDKPFRIVQANTSRARTFVHHRIERECRPRALRPNFDPSRAFRPSKAGAVGGASLPAQRIGDDLLQRGMTGRPAQEGFGPFRAGHEAGRIARAPRAG